MTDVLKVKFTRLRDWLQCGGKEEGESTVMGRFPKWLECGWSVASARTSLSDSPFHPQRPIECLRYRQCIKLFLNEWMHQSRVGPASYLHAQLQGDIYTECRVVSALALGSWRPLAWGWSPVTVAWVSQGKVLKKDLATARNGRSQIATNGGSLDPCHFQAIDGLSGQWQKNSRS